MFEFGRRALSPTVDARVAKPADCRMKPKKEARNDNPKCHHKRAQP